MSPTNTSAHNNIITQNYIQCTENDIADNPSCIFKSFPTPPRTSPPSPSSPSPISPILSPTYPLNSPLNPIQPLPFLLPPSSSADHRQIRRPSDAKPPLPHPCNMCNASFGDKRMLGLHKRVTHEQSSLLRCMHCPFLFGDAHQLNSHILNYHRDGSAPCTRCTAVFSNRALLKVHEKQHDTTAEMRSLCRCDYCDYTADTAGKLRFHMSDKHSGGENERDVKRPRITVLRGTAKFRLRADSAPVGKENHTNDNIGNKHHHHPPKPIRRSKGAFFLKTRNNN